ncbi:hypothetical protein CDD81_6954 [Ophiocordyceps australis]|uniref:Cytochrome P450 n=1 Tax=Ophiocordyceps australis TaxID=1399860 RepID=A0A2C5XBT4_9HYPO|nr:hypothetical protein CDD81_6954 [Ophiocordyceps australis]
MAGEMRGWSVPKAGGCRRRRHRVIRRPGTLSGSAGHALGPVAAMSQPIPQPRGIPLLGNIFDVNPANTWTSLNKLSVQYGEIFKIKALGKTIVFVSSVALAEELCDEKRFRKYVGGPIVEIRAAVNAALFTCYESEDEVWGVAHRIMAPQLQPAALALHFDEMRDTTRELLDTWKQAGQSSISPLGDLSRLNLELTTQTLTGCKMDALTGPENPMLRAMEDSTSEAMMRPTRMSLVNWLLYGRKFKSAIKTMRTWAQGIVEQHKQKYGDERPNNLLSAMLHEKDPATGKGLTETQVIDELVSMPIGSATTPCMLAYALFLLLKNPDKMAKARDEIDGLLGDGELKLEHLEQLKYVEAVVRETLRLSCAAAGFNIEPRPRDKAGDTSPVMLAGGKYQVPHNQPMIIVMYGVNRDPAVFDEPEAFRPERFMGAEFERLPPGAKKWFGNGKRRCIGEHWAWQCSMVVLVLMLREMDFEMKDAAYSMFQDGWFAIRPVGFDLKVQARAREA